MVAYSSPVAYYRKNVEVSSSDASGSDEKSCEFYKTQLADARGHRGGIGEVSFESFDVVDAPLGADLARGKVYSTIQTELQRRAKTQERVVRCRLWRRMVFSTNYI